MKGFSLLYVRLSQAAGDKLRQNNPAISDLSDPYRPTKLSEMFSELYDNEWTNAMDLMDSDCSEQKAVQTLLRIQLVKYHSLSCYINVFTCFKRMKLVHNFFQTGNFFSERFQAL